MSSAASAEVRVADVSISATANPKSSTRSSRIGHRMAEPKSSDDKSSSRASSHIPMPPQYSAPAQSNRDTRILPVQPTSGPAHLEFPNLEQPSIALSTTQQYGHLGQEPRQDNLPLQKPFAASIGTDTAAAAAAAAGVEGDINRMPAAAANLELRVAHNSLVSVAATSGAAGASVQSRVRSRSPQHAAGQSLSLLASVSSTDLCNFDQISASTLQASNRIQTSPSAAGSRSLMDTQPSTVSTTATATRATTPSGNPSGTHIAALDSAAAAVAACQAPGEASVRASSMPDAPAPVGDIGHVLHSSASSSAPISRQPANSPFPQLNILTENTSSQDAAMDTGSDDNCSEQQQLPLESAASTRPDESEQFSPPAHHTRALSESHIEPIRSLTGLVLSPTSPPDSHRQLGLQAHPEHSQYSSTIEGYAGSTESTILQQILARMNDIHRYCESLVQMQVHQGEQISSLEATIRQCSLPFFSRTPATGSATGPSAGPSPSRTAPQSHGVRLPAAEASSAFVESVDTGSSIPRVAQHQQEVHQRPYASEQGSTRAEQSMLQQGSERHLHRRHHHYSQGSHHIQQRYSYPSASAIPGIRPTSPTHRHLHQSRAAPYSTHTSPTMQLRRVQSPPPGKAARGQRLSAASVSQLSRHEVGLIREQSEAARRQSLLRSQQQQQQQLEVAAGSEQGVQAHYAASGSSSRARLGTHGPLPSGQLGMVSSATSMSTIADYSSSEAQRQQQQQQQQMGVSEPRMRPVHMVDTSDPNMSGSSGREAETGNIHASPYPHSSHQHQQQRYYHIQQQQQQQQQHMFPPIHAGGMVRGAVEQQSSLSRAGRPSSLQLIQPDSIISGPKGSVDKGKGSMGHQPEAAGSSQAAQQPKAGNPDAQPTAAWLSTQRHYKNAFLHLLNLETFYPTDVAMLNTFRALPDFTNEQIEANAATLLSWARGWLRYNRNAVLRNTLDNKAKASLTQLAEALQHDMHAETDFTTPSNLRRCGLLRLIYYQWQAENKLGTKSRSMYRDYETRLREIEALPSREEQEAEWREILEEEQSRRLALIRESRGSGGSSILPRPEQQSPQQRQQTPRQQMMPHRQSIEHAMHSGTQTPVPQGQAHFYQQAFSQQYRRPMVPGSQYSPAQQYQFRHPSQQRGFPGGPERHQQAWPMDTTEGWQSRETAQATGKDNDSDMSVKLSPEP
ncbi:hypothetical protein EV183_002991 [Coemansia sp. RSA 2336]|nr:hypothetical protein EV183_002991 [Coemansia sp. RSA 2336]